MDFNAKFSLERKKKKQNNDGKDRKQMKFFPSPAQLTLDTFFFLVVRFLKIFTHLF